MHTILDRFAPLMSEALHCAGSPEGLALPLSEAQARLLALAEAERALPAGAAEAAALSGGREGRGRLERSRFAVYAWADEKMLNAPRPDAAAWMGFSLQSRFFDTTEGGHLFFAHLDELLDGLGVARLKEGTPIGLDRRLELAAELPPEGREVLAAHALCLLYGFSGRLFAEPELLAGIRKAAHGLLPRRPDERGAGRVLPALEGGRAALSGLEPVLYALVPIAVTALFALFCAAVLANVPVRGL